MKNETDNIINELLAGKDNFLILPGPRHNQTDQYVHYYIISFITRDHIEYEGSYYNELGLHELQKWVDSNN